MSFTRELAARARIPSFAIDVAEKEVTRVALTSGTRLGPYEIVALLGERPVGGFQYHATFPLWQVARRDTLTGDEDVLTQAPGSAVRPVLTPDGTLLAYATRLDTETELRVRDLRTGDDRRVVEVVQQVRACRDPRDDQILEAAVNGRADVIITGDNDLLELHPLRGSAIVTPADYLLR